MHAVVPFSSIICCGKWKMEMHQKKWHSNPHFFMSSMAVVGLSIATQNYCAKTRIAKCVKIAINLQHLKNKI
jgi:hypothetical protein